MSTSHAPEGGRKMSLTMKVMIGMVAGLAVGVIFNTVNSEFINDTIVNGLFTMVGTMFVNALKMLVVPLVIFSLICGVTGIGDIRVLGRVGGKSFALYMFTTAVAIAVAMTLAVIVGPGTGFDMAGVDTSGVEAAEAPTVWEVFANIVPTNPIAAFTNGEMLQIIFYVIIVGIAALMLGDR